MQVNEKVVVVLRWTFNKTTVWRGSLYQVSNHHDLRVEWEFSRDLLEIVSKGHRSIYLDYCYKYKPYTYSFITNGAQGLEHDSWDVHSRLKRPLFVPSSSVVSRPFIPSTLSLDWVKKRLESTGTISICPYKGVVLLRSKILTEIQVSQTVYNNLRGGFSNKNQ